MPSPSKSEGYIDAVPEFVVTKPDDRDVMWEDEQVTAIAKEIERLGFLSLALGTLVSWCIGQNPCDVWTLTRAAFVNRSIDVTRSKTGAGGAPIPLWSDLADKVERYLAANPALPDAPLFRHENLGGQWHEQTRLKWFRIARRNLKLPDHLQMRDLRRTMIVEAEGLGFTDGQIRTVSRHESDQGLKPYKKLAAKRNNTIVTTIQEARGKLRKVVSDK